MEFDEEGYLNAFPDVASAVKRGAFSSGQEHYQKHGMKEGRKWSFSRPSYDRATAKNPQIFYFHTPKTAGTSINSYFTSCFKNSITHAESQGDRLSEDFLGRYQYASGHLSHSRIARMLGHNWVKIISFREPYSQVISHLAWVRRLADKGEERRFKSHPKKFQNIALKMKKMDFSNAADLHHLAEWLKSINFNYFFNTQTIYLDSNKNLAVALENLYDFDFVVISEEMDAFFQIMNAEFSPDNIYRKTAWENINEKKYGFDIENKETRLALLPFIEKDIVVYSEAKRIFNALAHDYKKGFRDDIMGGVEDISFGEINGWCRFKSSLKKVDLELRKDGVILAKSQANIFRAALKEKSIHPTGRCAFNIRFDEDLDITQCGVYVAESDLLLPHLDN